MDCQEPGTKITGNYARRISDASAITLPSSIGYRNDKNTLKTLINSWHSLVEIIEEKKPFSPETHQMNMEKVVKLREISEENESKFVNNPNLMSYSGTGMFNNSDISQSKIALDFKSQGDEIEEFTNIFLTGRRPDLQIGSNREYYPQSKPVSSTKLLNGTLQQCQDKFSSLKIADIRSNTLKNSKNVMIKDIGNIGLIQERSTDWSFKLGSILKNKLYMLEYIRKGIELNKLNFYNTEIDMNIFEKWYFKDDKSSGIVKGIQFVMEETIGFKDRLRYEAFARNMGIRANVVQYGKNLIRLRTYDQDAMTRTGNVNHEIVLEWIKNRMDILEGSKLRIQCVNIKKPELHRRTNKIFQILNNPNISRPAFMRNEGTITNECQQKIKLLAKSKEFRVIEENGKTKIKKSEVYADPNSDMNQTRQFNTKLSLLRKNFTEKAEVDDSSSGVETYTSQTEIFGYLNDDCKTLNGKLGFGVTPHYAKNKYEYAFNFEWESQTAFSSRSENGMLSQVISKEKLNTLGVEECIESAIFNNRWTIVKKSLEQFQLDDNVQKDSDSASFNDRTYYTKLFQDNPHTTKQYYNVAKWNNSPMDKMNSDRTPMNSYQNTDQSDLSGKTVRDNFITRPSDFGQNQSKVEPQEELTLNKKKCSGFGMLDLDNSKNAKWHRSSYSKSNSAAGINDGLNDYMAEIVQKRKISKNLGKIRMDEQTSESVRTTQLVKAFEEEINVIDEVPHLDLNIITKDKSEEYIEVHKMSIKDAESNLEKND